MKYPLRSIAGHVAIALTTLLSANSVWAQAAAAAEGQPVGAVPATMQTLPCCHCLGEQTKIDLSTGSAPWVVSFAGGPYTPVALVTNPSTTWSATLPPAKWLGNSSNNAAAGVYRYKVRFYVPKCAIAANVTVSGEMLADNGATVVLSGSAGGPFTTANFPNGFLMANKASFNFTVLGPGYHELLATVTNELGPTGLLLKATAVRQCVKTDPGGPAVQGTELDRILEPAKP